MKEQHYENKTIAGMPLQGYVVVMYIPLAMSGLGLDVNYLSQGGGVGFYEPSYQRPRKRMEKEQPNSGYIKKTKDGKYVLNYTALEKLLKTDTTREAPGEQQATVH